MQNKRRYFLKTPFPSLLYVAFLVAGALDIRGGEISNPGEESLIRLPQNTRAQLPLNTPRPD